MNHDDAIESLAAERYILDDLEPSERDAFEEHFFDCTECTADVRDAAKVADGVRTGIRVVPVKHYTRWAAAAAGAAVAIGLAYQYVPQVAGLWKHSPAPIGQPARVIAPEKVIELEATRGAAAVYHVRANQPAGIYFTIPPSDVPPSAYTCALLHASGHVLKTVEVRRDQAAEPVRLSLSAGTLRKGDYKLVIRGGDREIPAYPFTVEVP
jgi:hypothetical protein